MATMSTILSTATCRCCCALRMVTSSYDMNLPSALRSGLVRSFQAIRHVTSQQDSLMLTTRRRFSTFSSLNRDVLTATATSTSVGTSVLLQHSGRTVLVERVNGKLIDHVTEVIDLVADAVNRGDNIGIDEFPSATELQVKLIDDTADLFTVRESSASRRLLAAIFVEPCQAARTIRPHLAAINVIASDDISRDVHAFRDIARLAVQLVTKVNRGYVASIVSVYYVCVQTLTTWLREGFIVTACLPLIGQLKHSTMATAGEQSATLTSSYLLYKKVDTISSDDEQVKGESEAELVAYADKICSGVSTHPDAELAQWSQAPSFNFLPVTFRLPTSGIEVNLRMLRGPDVGRYYETFLEAATIDQGFRREEIPTRRFFSWLYSRYWNYVFEDAATGDWIAVGVIAPSPLSRNRTQSSLCDGSLIITPAYRRRRGGLPSDLLRVWSQLSVDAGFKACLSDTAFDNIEAIHISFKHGLIGVGSLPGAMLSRDPDRSSDVILLYRSLEDTPSFESCLTKMK